jgi:hypothetical protein
MMRQRWYLGIIAIGLALNTALVAVLFRRRSQAHAQQFTPDRPVAVSPASAPQHVVVPLPASPVTPVLESYVQTPPHPASWAVRWRALPLDTILFTGTLLVFALTRFIGLVDFPIYFFTDEAIQTVQAANLIHHGFRDAAGQLLPTYFQNGDYFNLSVSVYAQVLPYWIFGYSIFVTRGVSVLVALSGAAAVGLILKQFFQVRWWWAGTLLLSITPAFFLHSRTAFETVIGVSMYAWALYFYLRYRYRGPRSLPLALLFGALCFYAYSPAQIVVVVTGILLLMSDARYHWQTLRRQPLLLTVSIVFLIVLAAPYLKFQSQRPAESYYHLRILDSYLLKPALTTGEKLQTFLSEYTYGLSPAYWYLPNDHDLIRHVMKGYGHIFLATLPFMLIGLAICLKRWRSSAHRALLIALLVAPAGSALVQVQIYRELIFVVPAALITTLGLVKVLELLLKRLSYRTIALGLFAVLSTVNFLMLYDALNNGPRWYTDYHIGGLQYGGKEIFSAVKEYLKQAPDDRVIVSPTWGNGTDVLQWFFLPDDPRVQMGNIDAYREYKLDLPDNVVFVMTPDEWERAQSDGKFTNQREVRAPLTYPDGRDGFYFVKLNYSPQAATLFEAEQVARHQLVREQFELGGQTIDVQHSQLDMGVLSDLFDGDPYTLVRTLADNPAIIELTFAEPQVLTGLELTTATMDYTATVKLTPADGSAPQVYTRDFIRLGSDPTVDFAFDPAPTGPIKTLRLEVKGLDQPSDAHIHIREIKLKQAR